MNTKNYIIHGCCGLVLLTILLVLYSVNINEDDRISGAKLTNIQPAKAVRKSLLKNISDQSSSSKISFTAAGETEDYSPIIKIFETKLQDLEASRLEKKEIFLRNHDLKKLCIVLRRPLHHEQEMMEAAKREAEDMLSKLNLDDNKRNKALDMLNERLAFFDNYDKTYRIINIVPYFSVKLNAWTFFYSIFDSDKVIIAIDSDGKETGFASDTDGGKREETEDRKFSEWRYSYLATSSELDSLVPDDDTQAKEEYISKWRKITKTN